MPQLDKFIIMSNIFWLFIFFSFVLFFLSTTSLPVILKTLRIREYKLTFFSLDIFKNINEAFLVARILKNFMGFKLNTLKIDFDFFCKKFFKWMSNFKSLY